MQQMSTDLLTNATVVDDAIRFVSQKSKEKLEASSSSEGEQNEPNCDEVTRDKVAAVITTKTTNEVF